MQIFTVMLDPLDQFQLSYWISEVSQAKHEFTFNQQSC